MRSVQSTLFAFFAASSAAYADTTLNLTQGVSPISHDVYELHMTIFWICVVIGCLVFGAMFYAMFHYRKSRGAIPAEFHSHPILEITWTIVPVIILILMAIPATRVLINMNNIEKDDITIKITGYQWKWHYEYLEDNIKFFSNLSTPLAQMQNKEPKGIHYLREVDNPIVVPIHKKIRFLITSNDVNHAWWVPDFGIKRDAIAGFINEAWTKIDKPGTYRGQCAELCGINHAFMPIVVVATTEQGYKDWVAKQKGQATAGEADTNRQWTMDELMKHGEQIYNRICAACHQPGGVGLPPTFPPLKGDKFTTGPIGDHINVVFNGKSGTAMQAFKNQLTDSDIASVVTYERNAFGNNTGTSVQPISIKALRDGKSMSDALAAKPSASAAAKPQAAPAAEAKVPTATSTKAAPDTKSQTIQSAAEPNVAASQASSAQSTTSAQAAQPTAAVATSAAAPGDSADALKAAIERGQKVYMTTCAVCHQPEGQGMPPTFPALKGDKFTKGPLELHLNRVLNGKPGTAMQAFRDQLDDQQIADVVTYERNAWGNNMGNLVTPDIVKSAKSKPPLQE